MHSNDYLEETIKIASLIDPESIETMVKELVSLRERKGRLFIIGIGGSAANASHTVNDMRKLCGIEAYTPVDNVAELTARANDEGWEIIFQDGLKASNITVDDAVMVLSVGGGTEKVSLPITNALRWLQRIGSVILGIVGPNGGLTKTYGKCVINIPLIEAKRITPHTEGWQSVILHCIVSHPDLQQRRTKW